MKMIMPIFGTRPEAIKMASVIKELRAHDDKIRTVITVTAQHRHLLDQALGFFKIRPDHDLDIMRDVQTPTDVVGRILLHLEAVLKKEKPDLVVVQGDTSTSLAGSLAAFYQKTPIAHLEAGLRTWQKYSPYPEEMNRQLVDSLSDIHLAPTELAKQNLLREGHNERSIFVVGNTAIDVLTDLIPNPREIDEQVTQSLIKKGAKVILLTAHRRENIGEPLRNICQTLRDIAQNFPNEIQIIYPVHPNPAVRQIASTILKGMPNVSLIEPLPYNLFIPVLNRAYLVITDSGGVQEEAAYLGKPVLVLRDRTERPESIEKGTAKLVGADSEKLRDEVVTLLSNASYYSKMAKMTDPYGKTNAAVKVVNHILDYVANQD